MGEPTEALADAAVVTVDSPLLLAADHLSQTANDYDCGDECARCKPLREAAMAYEYERSAIQAAKEAERE